MHLFILKQLKRSLFLFIRHGLNRARYQIRVSYKTTMDNPPNSTPVPLPRPFCRLLKAHHLGKIQSFTENAVEPRNLAKTSSYLKGCLRPALPNPRTTLLAEGNARNWYHTSMDILEDHYMAEIHSIKETLILRREEDWSPAWYQAVNWTMIDMHGVDSFLVQWVATVVEDILSIILPPSGSNNTTSHPSSLPRRP